MEDLVYDDGPSRLASEYEEEEAEATAGVCSDPAITLMSLWASRENEGAALAVDILLVACSQCARLLLQPACSKLSTLGSVALRSTDFKSNRVKPAATCNAAICYVNSTSAGTPRVAIASCGLQVPPECALSVARALFDLVKPSCTIVLADLPAQNYQGPGDPFQAQVSVCLQTDAARERMPQAPMPHLGAGDMVSGLPAALLSYAQARAMDATLVAQVDAHPGVSAARVVECSSRIEALLSAMKVSGAATLLDFPAAIKAAQSHAAAASSFVYI